MLRFRGLFYQEPSPARFDPISPALSKRRADLLREIDFFSHTYWTTNNLRDPPTWDWHPEDLWSKAGFDWNEDMSEDECLEVWRANLERILLDTVEDEDVSLRDVLKTAWTYYSTSPTRWRLHDDYLRWLRYYAKLSPEKEKAYGRTFYGDEAAFDEWRTELEDLIPEEPEYKQSAEYLKLLESRKPEELNSAGRLGMEIDGIECQIRDAYDIVTVGMPRFQYTHWKKLLEAMRQTSLHPETRAKLLISALDEFVLTIPRGRPGFVVRSEWSVWANVIFGSTQIRLEPFAGHTAIHDSLDEFEWLDELAL
ncbi:hypothetical protein BCR34DRAFT_617564 [Clohesyomyces aquaticus]|uniref:Uncharacterized protein n=1 Tax=Clohesyomyces aquaticus TaxID=1231657 RepID=A0A1Y1Z1E9_9PLEO|nr:hypothetical protein BCR34DRAFT_617564 [Clohesyomyces aquaticus]